MDSSKIHLVALLIIVSLLVNSVQSTREHSFSKEICGANDPIVYCKRKYDCIEKCGDRPPYKKTLCVRSGQGYTRMCCCVGQ